MRLAAAVQGGGIWTSVGRVSNLKAGTLYNYRLVGLNNASTVLGSNLTFITSPLAPSVSTLAASSVKATNCTLNGTVNPNGAATAAYFRYGLTTNYGNFSTTNVLPATNATILISKLVGSLTPVTTYHFQLVSTNLLGTSVGADRTFTTTVALPGVTTSAASGITTTTATLNGSVSPGGAAAGYYFQYGATTNYGSATGVSNLVAGATSVSVSNAVAGLSLGTLYHFRLIATNSVGSNAGADLTFTTLAVAPTAITQTASVTASTAPPFIGSAILLTNGAFQLTFTNTNNIAFSVLGTIDLRLPASNWTVLGLSTNIGGGRQGFTDSEATNFATRYYRLRFP
jgi:hypothetical protein